MLTHEPDKVPGSEQWPSAFNACQVGVSWKQIVPSEGKYRWDLLDAQLAWCRRQRLEIEAGPLIEFRPSALPDWIWLWEGDQETISGFVTEFVRQAVQRYRGKIPLWHVVHRPASQEILGLSEEEQIRITARAIQAARQADPAAQLSIGIDRPWAEWMSSSHFQLGPLHLCDYLLRSDLGISSVAIEVAPGYTNPGSHLRDLFEFSRLLDLYSLLNVPLHLTGGDPVGHRAGPEQRPHGPDRWIAVAGASRRGHAIHLGGSLAGPGAGEAVRAFGDLDAGQRFAAPSLSPRRAVPGRRQPQAHLPVAAIAEAGCHRMRTRCLQGGRSLYSLVRYPR